MALLYFSRGASLERVRFIPRQPTRKLMVELTAPRPKQPPPRKPKEKRLEVDDVFEGMGEG